MIIIKTIPLTLTDNQKKIGSWRLKQKLANQDLQVMKGSLHWTIEHDIPIKFLRDIVVTISIRKTDLKTSIDYSEIKDKESVDLIKLYLSGDRVSFANKWVTLRK